MVKMPLNDMLLRCPPAWQNFIKHLEVMEVPDKDGEGFTIKTLNAYLEPFRAKYNPANSVDFEDERYYNMFILKYGA